MSPQQDTPATGKDAALEHSADAGTGDATLWLVTWNVAGRTRGLTERQVAAVCRQPVDIVALQEVRWSALQLWVARLRSVGICHVLHTVTAKQCGVLLASRWPLDTSAFQSATCPSCVIAAHIHSDVGLIETLTVHVPNGGNHWYRKVGISGALHRSLATYCAGHRLLCGDFNSPDREYSEASIVVFGERDGGPARGGFITGRSVWDTTQALAERALMVGLAKFDLRDVYWQVAGAVPPPPSWFHGMKAGPASRRLDHVFASRSLGACTYDTLTHLVLDDRLSDHAAVRVGFKPVLIADDGVLPGGA